MTLKPPQPCVVCGKDTWSGCHCWHNGKFGWICAGCRDQPAPVKPKPHAGKTRPEGKGLAGIIELHRAPGTCCLEPSCDHAWHGKYSGLKPSERVALQCEGCGWSCGDCGRPA